jgi:hypothetical protein
MFIAMNRFNFEDGWLTRDSRLAEVKGFVAFHLRGPEREDHVVHRTPYGRRKKTLTPGPNPGNSAPRTSKAGERKPLTLGHPDFEGFEVIQTIEDTHSPR